MSDLNSEQAAVVELKNRRGARVIIAGPGTGKTKTMVALFNELREAGVPAANIRAVTFSKEAATTIEKRAGIKGVFSTFHSLGYEICSSVIRKPVEPELRYRLMCQLCRKWGLQYKDLDQFISQMRHANVSPAAAVESGKWGYAPSRAYAEYEKDRLAAGWMDFESMLCDAVAYLEDPQNRARWQFEYLIVDEAQDTDDLQWRMMQLLSEKHGNITVVGDPNQAIYTWRGASPENLTNFEKWFPGGRYFYLGRNYRSTQNVVKFVRENLPSDCPPALREAMVPARAEVGAPVGIKMFWGEDEEAEDALTKAQADPLNSIIIARTNRQLGVLERLCNEHSIRYHLLGKSGFWKQGEIRKVVEALKTYTALPLAAALNLAIPAVEKHYAVDDRTDLDNYALGNLASLKNQALKFQSTSEFVVWANKMMHRRNGAKGVTFATVHAAKGGEWKNVFLIGARADVMPHAKGDPREEARIYLVAISRAIDRLRISFAGTPSPYLRRYLTEDILDKLREKADEVDSLQAQTKLF